MIHIDWIQEGGDTIINLLGKYGRWLNARGRRICFLIWMVCISYWICVDFMRGLYAQTFFCIVSGALHIYGYVHWGKKFGKENV